MLLRRILDRLDNRRHDRLARHDHRVFARRPARFERRLLLRWFVMLAVCFGGLFAPLHYWPPYG